MRLALLVGSAYEKNGRVASIPSAEIDEGLIERRLREADADFKVVRFNAERGLAERIEQRLLAQNEPISELLVYFSGYSVLSEERGPALLLDGERLGTLSLTRLRNLFLVHSTSSCLIVDAAAVVDANQSLQEVVSAIGSTLTQNAPSISALVAVRNSAVQDSFGGSAFTGLVLTSLDWLAASREALEPVDLASLYAALSSDELTWKDVPAAGLFGEASHAFTILPPAPPAPRTALPARSELPLPSFESGPFDASLDSPPLSLEEPNTRPDIAVFDPSDELTPTNPHLKLNDSASAGEPLPSFALEDDGEVHRARLATDDGSGTRLVPKALVERLTEAGPPAEPAVESPDQLLARELEASLGRTRDTSERAGILAQLARVLVRLGQGERASVLFVEATQRDPLHLEVLMLRAEWAEAARDTANLMHTAETWLAVAPNDVRALALLGKAAERAGDVRRSLDVRLRVAQHSDCSPEERKRALRAAARIVRAEFADFEWAERLDECALSGAPLEPREDSRVAPLPAGPELGAAAAEPGVGHVPFDPAPEAPLAWQADSPGLGVVEPVVSHRFDAESFAHDEPDDDAPDDDDFDSEPSGSEPFSFELPAANAGLPEPRGATATVPDTEPTSEWLAREAATHAPAAATLAPQLESLASQPESLASQPESLASQPESLASQPESLASQPESLAPELPTLAPEPATLAPERPAFVSEPATLVPEAATLAPEAATLAPEAATLAPEAATLALEPATLAPEAEAWAESSVSNSPPQALPREMRRARAREFEHALRKNPHDPALREALIELYQSLDERESALTHCRHAARLLPTHPTTYRLAQAVFFADGDPDGAWNAASVLECLGEADINESLLVTQHRPEGLLAAQATLSESEWLDALFTRERDAELAPVLSALGPCAASVGTGFAKYKGRYRLPEPHTLQDPEKSTTMLAKTLSWTASMLGVGAPQLYVVADAGRELDVLAVETPSSAASRVLGSGLGLSELAFLWGRHLARYREEVKALSFFASAAELTALLHAALALGGARGVDVRSLDGDEKRLYSALRRELRGTALERLQAAARAVTVRELSARAEHELARLELLGVRAGLAVCGDVCAAAELIQRFPTPGLGISAQLAELYAFAISREYASLRRRLGVAIAA